MSFQLSLHSPLRRLLYIGLLTAGFVGAQPKAAWAQGYAEGLHLSYEYLLLQLHSAGEHQF